MSDSPSFLKEPTSEDMVEAIDQDELLSLAVATLRPVEISSWTLAMPLLMPFSVCRATIELVLVRIEDIVLSPSGVRRLRRRSCHGWPTLPWNR